jgi:hypothetical protein
MSNYSESIEQAVSDLAFYARQIHAVDIESTIVGLRKNATPAKLFEISTTHVDQLERGSALWQLCDTWDRYSSEESWQYRTMLLESVASYLSLPPSLLDRNMFAESWINSVSARRIADQLQKQLDQLN